MQDPTLAILALKMTASFYKALDTWQIYGPGVAFNNRLLGCFKATEALDKHLGVSLLESINFTPKPRHNSIDRGTGVGTLETAISKAIRFQNAVLDYLDTAGPTKAHLAILVEPLAELNELFDFTGEIDTMNNLVLAQLSLKLAISVQGVYYAVEGYNYTLIKELTALYATTKALDELLGLGLLAKVKKKTPASIVDEQGALVRIKVVLHDAIKFQRAVNAYLEGQSVDLSGYIKPYDGLSDVFEFSESI